MNARSQVFEISVESRQVEEAILGLFHTVMFHRTLGKFTYQRESSYYVGSVGYEDVDCDYIDHTYVRAQSPKLDATLRQEIEPTAIPMAASSSTATTTATTSSSVASTTRRGQVSLEFYQKRQARWPFSSADNIPWEVWTVRTDLLHFTNEQDRQRWQERVGEMLSDKVMYITEVMNRRGDFVPKMPTQGDIELVFDTSYTDVQPYLFKISYTTSGPNSPSVGSAVRRLFKDTLAI